MSMNRNTAQTSSSSSSSDISSNEEKLERENGQTHELVLIVEGMHLGRGKNDSTLNKISQGAANKARKKYVVVHLPLKTEHGDSVMRAQVATAVHQLIRHYNPNTVTLAIDYNIGNSGGECTLQEFSEFLMNPDPELNLPPILIDNQTLRAQRDTQQQADIAAQNKAKNLVIINYVLFGGNIHQLNAACEEFGSGKYSHWTMWRALMSKTMRPSTPDARHRSKIETSHHGLERSSFSVPSIDELGTTPLHHEVPNMDDPDIRSRTMSVPAGSSDASNNYGQMHSPAFSGSSTPSSFEVDFSPVSLPPSASPDDGIMSPGTHYQLSHIPPKVETGEQAASSPEMMLTDAQPSVLLPTAPSALATNPKLHKDDQRYFELIGEGHLDIPKEIIFNRPPKLYGFARRNSLEGMKHPNPHHPQLAEPQPMLVRTSPADGLNHATTSRFTTSKSIQGSPAGMFARRISATKALRIDLAAPEHVVEDLSHSQKKKLN
jgi:hypothetical protein